MFKIDPKLTNSHQGIVIIVGKRVLLLLSLLIFGHLMLCLNAQRMPEIEVDRAKKV